MKYTCTVDIKCPIDQVVALWTNEHYFKEWQDGFKSITLLSGTAHKVGAKSKIILEDKRRIELIETILVHNLPTAKTALYEHVQMTNTQKSQFSIINKNETRYTSTVEYLKFNGFIIRIIAKLFPGKFKAQSEKWMQQFKTFAEQKCLTTLFI